jgi:hypothetical protein
MDGSTIRARIIGKVSSGTAAKQRYGRAYARLLGLKPGKRGRDDLIDGEGYVDGRKLYFQCKLSQYELGAEYATEFYAGMELHEADVGIMLAGVGYKSQRGMGFEARLKKFPRIQNQIFKYYLLTLEDLYSQSEKFIEAQIDLPSMCQLVDLSSLYKLLGESNQED